MKTHTSVTIRREDGVKLELTLDHASGRVVLKKMQADSENTLYATSIEPLATREQKGAQPLMTTQPLDQRTCEAIVEHMDKIRREAIDDGAPVTEGYAEWALRKIREVTPGQPQPEPAAKPSVGAMRAIVGMRDHPDFGFNTDTEWATIIDEQTALPRLVEALRAVSHNADRLIADSDGVWYRVSARDMEFLRAALAEHDTGVSES